MVMFLWDIKTLDVDKWGFNVDVDKCTRGLTFARNPRNSMRDCNLLCCFRACFSYTASMQNIDITCVSWHFCAYLRRRLPKSPFEAYLKDILRNLQCFEPLTETSTNCKTLKGHQNNLTLNKP